MASQRFVMVVDPLERAGWGERAAKAGLTTAEFVRRAASAYDPEDAALLDELELLLPEFNAAIDNILSNIAKMNATLDYALDPQRDVEARAKARAAIDEDDIDAMERLIG